MANLPIELVKEFVNSTYDENKTKPTSRLYGTADVRSDGIYVLLDGSSVATPVSMATDAQTGDRVLVEIVDHRARVIQNINKSNSDIVADRIEKDETGVFKELRVGKEYVDSLVAKDITADSIEADRAKIGELEADNVTIKKTLTAQNASIENLEANKASIESLEAVNASIANLEANKASIESLEAVNASIKNLEADKLSANDADIKYAQIDFANIDFAAIEKAKLGELFTEAGIIKNLTTSTGTITGELVGVTIKGDLIEAGTLKADKLVVQGEDGLYYKLNVDALGKTEADKLGAEGQTKLHGSSIIAKSITATQISVDDLVAFGATIGGFQINDHQIKSINGKIVLNDNGSFILGGVSYNPETNTTAFDSNVIIGADGEGNKKTLGEVIVGSDIKYGLSTSQSTCTVTEWKGTVPDRTDGTYIWQRTTYYHADGSETKEDVCIQGTEGKSGEDAVLLQIDSSRGTVFKNNYVSTVLSVIIYKGSQRITDIDTLHSVFGSGAYIQWKWQRMDEESFGVISSTDSRLGNNGFTFTLSPDDVDAKVTFLCELIE